MDQRLQAALCGPYIPPAGVRKKESAYDHALLIQQGELLSPPREGCRFRGWPWTVRELRAGQRSADAGSNRPYQSWPRGRRRWLSAHEKKTRGLRSPIWRARGGGTPTAGWG